MASFKMMVLMGRILMRKTISCRQVTREISNYIDGELTPEIRERIEEHLRLCDHCSVVVDTMRKLLYIAGDEKVFEVPCECNVDWTKIMAASNPNPGPRQEQPPGRS